MNDSSDDETLFDDNAESDDATIGNSQPTDEEITLDQPPIGDSDSPVEAAPILGRRSKSRSSHSTGPDPTEPLNWPQIEGYEIKSHLGGGGFGEVFEARSIDLDATVAVKILKPRASASSKAVRRFEQEVKTAAQNRHRNIVQVLSRGESTSGPYANCHYLVTEFLSGGNFQDWIEENNDGRREFLVEAVTKMLAVCDALQAMHEAGVVHRDIKPANILLDQDGNPKVADFGLATFFDDDDERLTMTGDVLGTWAYMSPEQIRGAKNCTPRSDQYSLGVILYLLLCNLRPWQTSQRDTQERDRILANLNAMPKAPSSKRSTSDRQLQKICLRCLEPRAELRYASVSDLKADLIRWIQNEPLSSDKQLTRLWHQYAVRPVSKYPIRVIISVAVLLTLIAGVSGFGYQLMYVWPSVSYHADVVQRWGVYEGIDAIPIETVRRRNESYRITRQGWRGNVQTVERINGFQHLVQTPDTFLSIEQRGVPEFEHGMITPKTDPAVRFEYEYRDNHEVSRVSAYSSTGKNLWIKSYDSIYQARYQVAAQNTNSQGEGILALVRGGVAGSALLNSQSTIVPAVLNTGQSVAGAARVASIGVGDSTEVQYLYTPEGWKSVVVFVDGEGSPVENLAGIHGYKDVHDSIGRTTKRTYLDEQGEPTLSAFNVASVTCDFKPNLRVYTNRDNQGKPVVSTEGFASSESSLDELGRVESQRFFDAQAMPALNASQIHRATYDYDSYGQRILGKAFGLEDEPVVGNWGSHAIQLAYDSEGRMTSTKFLDKSNAPTLGIFGIHGVELSYDPKGFPNQLVFLGIDDQPTSRFGLLGGKFTYDDHGNVASVRNFDKEGKPTHNMQGFHGYDATYDDRGNLTELRYVDAANQPIAIKGGFARTTLEYDDQGLFHAQRYFGVDGQPTPHTDGNYAYKVKQDQHGNRIEESYFDADDQPMEVKSGYHRMTIAYDDAGNVIEKAFFNITGKPAMNSDGLHRWTATYDERGNQIEGSAFGVNKEPVIAWEGYHRWTGKYDDQNNLIEGRAFGVNNEPVLAWENYHRWTAQYDQAHNQTEKRFFNIDGAPMVNDEGLHRWTAEYDEQGNQIEGRAFGIDDQPIPAWGYHRWTAEFDDHGNQLSGRAFGVNNEPVLAWEGYHYWTKSYDVQGNAVEGKRFGIDSEPILPEGFFRWESEYNPQGDEIAWAAFGVNNEPVNNINGYHRWATNEATGNDQYFNKDGQEVVAHGLRVTEVYPGTQAEEKGIQVDDIVLSYDGVSGSMEEFLAVMTASASKTSPITIEAERNGESIEFKVNPGRLGLFMTPHFAPK